MLFVPSGPRKGTKKRLIDARQNDVKYAMATCKGCGEEVDEVVTVVVSGKRKKLCEECAEEAEHEADMAQESEAAVQQMMGFKGRR